MLLRLVVILSLLTSSSLIPAEDYSLWAVFTSEEKNEKFLPPDQAFQLDAIILFRTLSVVGRRIE